METTNIRILGKVKEVDNFGWQPLLDSMNYNGSLSGSRIKKELRSFGYACINKRAENVSKAEITLHSETNKGSEQIKSHPFLKLIKKPNENKQSFKNLLYFISVNLDLFGDAYLQIIRGALNLPIALIPMFSNCVTVELENNKKIKHYVYQNGLERTIILPEDIIHFKLYNPDSFVKGLATCKALDYIFDINDFQLKYLKEFYAHDSSFNFGLSTEENLTKEKADKIQDRWRAKHQGYKKYDEIAIFDNGTKPIFYNGTLRDNDLVKNRASIRDEILSIFSVPKVILAITDEVNYANASAGLKSFIDNTIFPFVDLNIHSTFDLFIQENYDEKLFTLFDYTNTYDRETQLKTIEVYRKYNVASVNEIREMEGLGKGTDQRDDDKYTPVNSSVKSEQTNFQNQN